MQEYICALVMVTFFETRRKSKSTDHLDILPDNLLHFLPFASQQSPLTHHASSTITSETSMRPGRAGSTE